MITLIKNEFYKQKREWSFLFLLMLSLLPVLTGGAGAIFNDSTKALTDLFFFMNNQFAMFFPMVLFILVGFLFYQEYKNKTYINWITYGYPKYKLFLTKVLVALIIGTCFALILLFLFFLLDFRFTDYRKNHRRHFRTSDDNHWFSVGNCHNNSCNCLCGSNRNQFKQKHYYSECNGCDIWVCILLLHWFRNRIYCAEWICIPDRIILL